MIIMLFITGMGSCCMIVAHFRFWDFYGFECSDGELLISRGCNIPVSPEAPAEPGLGAVEWRRGLYFDWVAAGEYLHSWTPRDPRPVPLAAVLARKRSLTSYHWHGFALQNDTNGAQSWSRVVMPLWPFTTVAAIVSAFSLIIYRAERQRRRLIASGRCARCGYDLRASADRCPECGTKIPSNPTSAIKAAT